MHSADPTDVEYLNGSCAEFNARLIDSVDVQSLPIFKLMNGSTITYGIRSFLNSEGGMTPVRFGCSAEIPAACGATSYRMLDAWNASRFFPYAGADAYATIPADMQYYSAYLAQDRLYTCRPGS